MRCIPRLMCVRFLSRSSFLPGLLALVVPVLCGVGCASEPRLPDLEVLYGEAAREIGGARNPVIVVPGILGSKLEDPAEMTPVWGAFTYGAADADTPRGARLVALPMELGKPLRLLRDDVVPTTVLDRFELDFALIVRGLEIEAYDEILLTLGAGGYRDRSLGESGAIDYGGDHYTCYQYPYDWRRDIAEQAAALHVYVLNARQAAQREEGLDQPPRVDVVAHSMGGLVLRYYLRYGPQPLPDDGSLPELTWEGARYVDSAVLIGTPNAGSVLSLRQLVEGVNYVGLITPTYSPAVLGTMPSIYQLLPRTRHARVIDEETGEPIEILDPEVWEHYEWGLANRSGLRAIRQLLPDEVTDEQCVAIARDHLRKCLARADQLFRALDIPATGDHAPPEHLRLSIVVGDARQTPAVYAINDRGRIRTAERAPGDDTVTRASALMDERAGSGYRPRLQSPVPWDHIYFLPDSHLGLTSNPVFSDNLLFELLERPW